MTDSVMCILRIDTLIRVPASCDCMYNVYICHKRHDDSFLRSICIYCFDVVREHKHTSLVVTVAVLNERHFSSITISEPAYFMCDRQCFVKRRMEVIVHT